jgi:hypothetical protein
MLGDTRDAWAYRIAVGALGLALVVALVGMVVLAAVNDPASSVASVSNSQTKVETVALKPETVLRTQDAIKIPVVPANKELMVDPKISVTPAEASKSADPAIPIGLYLLAAALVGALLGILIPLPWGSLPADVTLGNQRTSFPKLSQGAGGEALAIVAVAVVLVVVGLLLDGGATKKTVPIEIVLAVVGAALLGLLVPSPAKRR